MARKRIEKEINGCIYSIGEVSPTTRSKLMFKFSLILGPSILGAGLKKNLSKGNFKMEDLLNEELSVLLDKIVGKVDEDTLFDIFRQLLGQTYPLDRPVHILGEGSNFDIHFDEYGVMNIIPLMKEVFVFQFSSFFLGMGTKKSQIKEKQNTSSTKIL